jgi:hypothetical protein
MRKTLACQASTPAAHQAADARDDNWLHRRESERSPCLRVSFDRTNAFRNDGRLSRKKIKLTTTLALRR